MTQNNSRFIKLFDKFEKLEQNLAALLIHNYNLFKLLKFEDFNPLSHDISDEDIQDMITEFDAKLQRNPNCRVFFEPFTGTAEEQQKAQIRIYPAQVNPNNVYLGDLYVQVDVIVNQRISKIVGGRRRNRIASELIETLNGQDVGLVNDFRIVDKPVLAIRQFKGDFWGYSMLFTTGVSAIG